jgi:hypothetical protein
MLDRGNDSELFLKLSCCRARSPTTVGGKDVRRPSERSREVKVSRPTKRDGKEANL